jgi:adenylate kinase family enzyme
VRIAIVGTSGAGKTTVAKTLGAALSVPLIELDAVNWLAGWTSLAQTDPEEFRRRVAAASAADAWVVDGSYGIVRDVVWGRATHLLWLDYDRPLIMYRVIRRSLLRAARGNELWAGNHEKWSHLWHPSHPIRWAWDTWQRRRSETEEAVGQPQYAHLVVRRVRRSRELRRVIQDLLDQRGG